MDDDITINLSTEPCGKREKKFKSNKEDGNCQQRRGQRLAGKKTWQEPAVIQKNEDDTEKELNIKPNTSEKKTAKRKQPPDSENEPKKKSLKFSSLFKHNPNIPHVESMTNAQLSENVFSKNSFSALSLHQYMVSNLQSKMGMSEMTSVQQAAIPHILAGSDTLVKSQTGSGKTVAYAVPIVQALQAAVPKVTRGDGAYAIVVVPTRELAIQSFETFQKLLQPFTWIVPGVLMGGEKRKSEKARLRKGINIVVSTPGRLVDHIEHTNSLALDRVRWLVIDEADRLFDMGFEKEVKTLIEALDKTGVQHQTVLVSATLSAGVERLAGMSLREPVKVDMSDRPSSVSKKTVDVFATPENLRHHFVTVPHKLRLVSLAAFLLWKCKQSKAGKIVVFLSTQDTVEFHDRLFTSCLVKHFKQLILFKLHGDMKQKDRTEVFHKFSAAKSGILLCTDVAARGLDLPQVHWIVQYSPPSSATDYIHRAGRTARIGSQGQAVLFLAPSEISFVKLLQETNIRLQEISMDTILKSLMLEAATVKRENKAMPHTLEECATALQMRFEEHVTENTDTRNLARKAYQSFVRAYATYPVALKPVFHIKNLHLGHLAKSFGLQDSPSHIGQIIHNHAGDLYGKKIKKKGKKPARKRRLDQLSEFASGL